MESWPYAAPGQGVQSLRLHTVNEGASEEDHAIQLLPDVHMGDELLFHGWMINYYDGDPVASMGFGVCDSSSILSFFGPLISPGYVIWDWAYFEANISVPAEPLPGTSVCICLNGGTVSGGAGAAVGGPVFDGLNLLVNPSTSITDSDLARLSAPPHFPNPATDKLWIDLPEAPLSITAIDGTGRSIPLRTFHHIGRTVEVDVSSVPPGLCVMQVNLISGIRTVRFIKA